MAGELEKVTAAENESRTGQDLLTAYSRVPYALINNETDGAPNDTLEELTSICKYYDIYKKGKDFTVDGSNGDYVPVKLKYRMVATLINKQARFLFAEPPSIAFEPIGDVGDTTKEAKDTLTTYNALVRKILDENHFEDILFKAAKDCFIGKRVAGLVNFNPVDGVTISFLPSTQFLYETRIGNPNVLTKFVCFEIIKQSLSQIDKRIFKKKYTVELEELTDEQIADGIEPKSEVFLEEVIYDGAGKEIEVVTKKQIILLDVIPAVVFVNDGLTGDDNGESEVETLDDYEMWYSKMASGDLDAERKSMNPIRYAIDMEPNSTKKLSSSAGSFWDLQSDQNLDNPMPKAGMLESTMAYGNALKLSLDRIKTTGFEQVDVPNVSPETMQSIITSGKALKAVYWPLLLRCKEKMKMWGPQLRQMMTIIIKGAMEYPGCITRYVHDELKPVDYIVKVVQNMPLPEDEAEEKQTDMSEVETKVMSRKTYMKKWRDLSDDQVDEELDQIAHERTILEDASIPGNDEPPYSNVDKDVDGQQEQNEE